MSSIVDLSDPNAYIEHLPPLIRREDDPSTDGSKESKRMTTTHPHQSEAPAAESLVNRTVGR